jgi:hypothetical protein
MIKLKNYISFGIITSLILSGMFFYTDPSYGLMRHVTKTYYRLDTGVVFLWKNSAGAWQFGRDPGGADELSTSLKIPSGAENVAVTAYDQNADYEQESFFPFKADSEIESGCIIWNTTAVASNKDDYDTCYNAYSANPLIATSEYTQTTGNLKITYEATFSAFGGDDYDVKAKLAKGASGKQEIMDLLGSPSSEIMDAMDLMDPESENYSPNVEGYLYFLPVVIKYDLVEVVEISDFEPALNLPASAKQGEAFSVSDATVFEDEIEFERSELTCSVDGGTETEVSSWDGSVLGTSVSQSFDEVCNVDYTLTVWNTSGNSKSVTKSIDIVDARSITVEADLVIPPYTYLGHSELAEDQSTFTVDGTAYSASRAYAEDVAKNSFSANSSSISISRLNNTKANASFSEIGTYRMTLNVKTADGKKVSDSESITVRKTPYIIDSLSGFQKQNRKQILAAMIATTPGKPLTDYSITLKDKKTGDSVILTPDNPQQNTSVIKTRAVTMTQDTKEGYAFITVEFLTKTPSYFSTGTKAQDFYYEINVADCKGDTDSTSKSFAVSPDLPPAASVSLNTSYLRNEGTNIATITPEDITVATDGDDVERTWYYGATASPAVFVDVSTMAGYKKLSFGTDKIVGFDRTGVGPLTVKLFDKEKWTEPTLEEYVTDDEHLTGSAITYTEVQNVAPVVSLELLNSTEQEILLLANNAADYQALLNNKTALQQALLANQIDGQIIIKKLLGSTPSNVTSVSKQKSVSYQYGPTVLSGTLASEVDESNLLAVDSENTYFLTYTWLNGSAAVPKTIHAINTYCGEVWSYTTSRNEDFIFGQDDTNQYLYLIYKNSGQTVLIDKKTGTVAGTINTSLSNRVWLSDNLFFVVNDSSELCAIDQKSLIKTIVASNISSVSRVGGNLQFITKSASGIVRNILDMETLDIQSQMIIPIASITASPDDYIPLCIDSKGKIVIFKQKGTGTDPFNGFMAYDTANALTQKISVTSESGSRTAYCALDENGECNYAMVWYYDPSTSPNSNSLYGANLKSGALASYYKRTDAYDNAHGSYAGAFESNGAAYFMFNGWYLYPGGSGYYGNHFTFSVSGASAGMNVNGPGGVSSVDENIQLSDRSIASFWGNNSPSNGIFDLNITAIPRTLAQETSEIISRFTDKLTFVGDVNTTVAQLKSVADAPKPTIKITASKNGYLSMPNQPLEQNKQYYYGCDIKPLTDGTSSKLSGIAASTGTTISPEPFLNDTYYVENTYIEDFADGKTNKFFSLGSPGLWTSRGVFGSNNYDDGTKVDAASLTFTIPAGKKAILSFDYSLMTDSSADVGACVYVDGEREYVNYAAADKAVWDHCTHMNILSAGTHTVSCSGARWYVWIDNMKVEVLSTTRPALVSKFYSQDGETEGWLNCSGRFQTPNETISYGSQASSFYTGGVSYTVTGTFGNGAPKNITYYQTVPAGYLQRSYAYPAGSGGSKDQLGFTIDGVYYRMGYRGDIGSGQKMYIAEKTEGTYSHYTVAASKTSSAVIPRFDLITYPSNAVTKTGDISFNDIYTEYFFPKESSTRQTCLSMYLPKGEYLLKNLKIYYIEEGQKIYLQNEDCEELADLSKWSLSSGLSASILTPTEEKTDDEYVKIYRKGEKVLYNIFYDDYEKDPSKTGYWVYTHIPWPPDTLHPAVGKVLTAPIDRFYLSGKYTVTHWKVDNTQRAGTVGDAAPYNKESNKVTMTFYVDGEGKAPWITYIRTNPSAVKENANYTIQVGVDDTEKDTLALTMEVYLKGKLIKTDIKSGLQADASGDYPEQTVAGIPPAVPGVYQVVCTVSDHSGTGIKSYRYTVVSEGSVDGLVSHTEQWDLNRKKYNLKRFGEEFNRLVAFDDYKSLPAPRKRGANVFWSGERFQLRAETEGDPVSVTVRILSKDTSGTLKATGYSTELTSTGKTTGSGGEVWKGSLWDAGMINQWGRNIPSELTFRFIANYAGGTTKEDSTTVIMDSDRDYWLLHRLW